MLVIRGLALGTIHDGNARQFLTEELKMGATLSFVIGIAGCVRAAVFFVPIPETVAITVSLCTIVWTSVLLGAILPLGMKSLHIDPAHSSTTIQVLMDILGVTITVCKYMPLGLTRILDLLGLIFLTLSCNSLLYKRREWIHFGLCI